MESYLLSQKIQCKYNQKSKTHSIQMFLRPLGPQYASNCVYTCTKWPHLKAGLSSSWLQPIASPRIQCLLGALEVFEWTNQYLTKGIQGVALSCIQEKLEKEAQTLPYCHLPLRTSPISWLKVAMTVGLSVWGSYKNCHFLSWRGFRRIDKHFF